MIIVPNENKCPNSGWMMEIYELQKSDYPSLGLWLTKMDYGKVGHGLGLEREIL